jgi:hypothetical protein
VNAPRSAPAPAYDEEDEEEEVDEGPLR